jgi:para-nitrobenzyl esterase
LPGHALPAAVAARAGSADGGGPIVATGKGKVQGKSAKGIDQFLGIPYAAPPVGPLRWAAPQPVTPWHGIRSAQSYGNRCPQLASGNGPRSDNEDCLYLNVFTPPDSAGRPPGGPVAHGGRGGGRLPVLVMIHGAGW